MLRFVHPGLLCLALSLLAACTPTGGGSSDAGGPLDASLAADAGPADAAPACEPTCVGRACGPDGCGGQCGACGDAQACTGDGRCVQVPPECVPDCADRVCGPDGCGGTCGACDDGEACTNAGACRAVCDPACDGRTCGPDGCGGDCGACPEGEACSGDGACQAVCTPACDGRACGPDGCGGTCGGCADGQACDGQGQCVALPPQCEPDCADRACGPDGCGGACGACPGGQVCDGAGACQPGCVPQCDGRACGPDGCGGNCGACPGGQACGGDGQCRAVCQPDCEGRACGPDGCGGDCGVCADGDACSVEGQCRAVCRPDCVGRECGPDSCGGSCGDCADGDACAGDGQCQAICQPACAGRACGPDGCGGACGACGANQQCVDGGQCEAIAQAPRILALNTDGNRLTVGDSVRISAIVTDPQGIQDLIGGTLDDPAGGSYGAFVSSGDEGAYSVEVAWADLHRLSPIEFEGAEGQRTLRARFFDQAGNDTVGEVRLTLHCNGQAACDGICRDLQRDADHCGGCGEVCPAVEIQAACSAGACGSPCRDPERRDLCDGECTDLDTIDDCGACGNACPAPEGQLPLCSEQRCTGRVANHVYDYEPGFTRRVTMGPGWRTLVRLMVDAPSALAVRVATSPDRRGQSCGNGVNAWQVWQVAADETWTYHSDACAPAALAPGRYVLRATPHVQMDDGLLQVQLYPPGPSLPAVEAQVDGQPWWTHPEGGGNEVILPVSPEGAAGSFVIARTAGYCQPYTVQVRTPEGDVVTEAPHRCQATPTQLFVSEPRDDLVVAVQGGAPFSEIHLEAAPAVGWTSSEGLRGLSSGPVAAGEPKTLAWANLNEQPGTHVVHHADLGVRSEITFDPGCSADEQLFMALLRVPPGGEAELLAEPIQCRTFTRELAPGHYVWRLWSFTRNRLQVVPVLTIAPLVDPIPLWTRRVPDSLGIGAHEVPVPPLVRGTPQRFVFFLRNRDRVVVRFGLDRGRCTAGDPSMVVSTLDGERLRRSDNGGPGLCPGMDVELDPGPYVVHLTNPDGAPAEGGTLFIDYP